MRAKYSARAEIRGHEYSNRLKTQRIYMDGREFELKNSKFRAGTAFEIYVIEE